MAMGGIEPQTRGREINLINIESFPNVEYGKMRSEPDECALGVDLRGIHPAFYFY